MGGAAVAGGAFLAACKGKTEQTPVTGSIPPEPSSTTTTAPGSPEENVVWMRTLQSLELTCIDVTQKMLDKKLITDQQSLTWVNLILQQHKDHVTQLTQVITGLGSQPVTDPNAFVAKNTTDAAVKGADTETAAISAIQTAENIATQTATKSAAFMTTSSLRQTSASIAASDAVHLSALRLLLDQDPVSLPLMATGAAVAQQGYIRVGRLSPEPGRVAPGPGRPVAHCGGDGESVG